LESCCFPIVEVPQKKIGPFNFQFKILKKVFTNGINIVCFDLHWPTPICGGILAKIFWGHPLIFWGHGFGHSKIAKFVKKILLKFADGIILYGYRGHKVLLESGILEKKLFVAPNSIVIKNGRNCAYEPKTHFLFVGRLQKRKKINLLIQAFSKIEYGDLKLIIVGDGDIKNELKELCSILKIEDNVLFLPGTNDHQKLLPLFSNALAYVSPGACGLGVLHSFAHGIPIITCNDSNHGPEIEWVTNGFNGIISPSDSVDNIVLALKVLTENPFYAQQLGNNSFKTFAKASPEEMLKGFLSAIKKAAICYE
jgi:glycosyltransferase involved in cell wall biosynthesis